MRCVLARICEVDDSVVVVRELSPVVVIDHGEKLLVVVMCFYMIGPPWV